MLVGELLVISSRITGAWCENGTNTVASGILRLVLLGGLGDNEVPCTKSHLPPPVSFAGAETRPVPGQLRISTTQTKGGA